MSNLIPTVKNGSESNSRLGLRRLPTISSWLDDMLNTSFGGEFMSNFNTGLTLPAVNVQDKADEYIVQMAVPGLKKSDFDINLDNDLLSISAEIESESNEENDDFTRREFGYSSFRRTFSLPKTVEADKIKAKYEDGILNVILPKREEAKKKPAKQIKIS
ncbi:MAG: Hsp20/alpha crystallin family protein [Winogradskyella sp.]|nr:Hsp20/alpha crystallin family protein [Winogradskyella sp.]MBT8376265.1 Hsp20/alpha crystallin family protein [Bacteroidia bacterium]NNC45905.1 Hsp20/alpha crystallin family protein [Winogradskyella sp.]NNF85637.1 Hsp20/alpha crystallin family protein [Winogradskyella sp.]NNK39567.1 Hsp20/alpha crystallin family protein [Winogradskyella sp.]